MNNLVRIKVKDIILFETPLSKKLHEEFKYFIFDQTHYLSCSVSAAISLIEYLRQKEGKECEKFSVGFLYHDALQGSSELNNGLKTSSVLKSLIHDGVCLQKRWSSLNEPTIEPSQEAVMESLSRIKHCNIECLEIDISTIRYTIGFCERPIVAIMTIYDKKKFYTINTSYDVIGIPSHNNNDSIKHSILLVGYDDSERIIYFQNSYGEEWGNKGFGRISYDYIPYFDLLYSMDESCIKGSIDETIDN